MYVCFRQFKKCWSKMYVYRKGKKNSNADALAEKNLIRTQLPRAVSLASLINWQSVSNPLIGRSMREAY